MHYKYLTLQKIIMYNVLKLITERNSKSTQYKRQYRHIVSVRI